MPDSAPNTKEAYVRPHQCFRYQKPDGDAASADTDSDDPAADRDSGEH